MNTKNWLALEVEKEGQDRKYKRPSTNNRALNRYYIRILELEQAMKDIMTVTPATEVAAIMADKALRSDYR